MVTVNGPLCIIYEVRLLITASKRQIKLGELYT